MTSHPSTSTPGYAKDTTGNSLIQKSRYVPALDVNPGHCRKVTATFTTAGCLKDLRLTLHQRNHGRKSQSVSHRSAQESLYRKSFVRLITQRLITGSIYSMILADLLDSAPNRGTKEGRYARLLNASGHITARVTVPFITRGIRAGFLSRAAISSTKKTALNHAPSQGARECLRQWVSAICTSSERSADSQCTQSRHYRRMSVFLSELFGRQIRGISTLRRIMAGSVSIASSWRSMLGDLSVKASRSTIKTGIGEITISIIWNFGLLLNRLVREFQTRLHGQSIFYGSMLQTC